MRFFVVYFEQPRNRRAGDSSSSYDPRLHTTKTLNMYIIYRDPPCSCAWILPDLRQVAVFFMSPSATRRIGLLRLHGSHISAAKALSVRLGQQQFTFLRFLDVRGPWRPPSSESACFQVSIQWDRLVDLVGVKKTQLVFCSSNRAYDTMSW